jgi:hypothetical protein
MANTDPSSLANQATCFISCLSPGSELAVQTYLLALAAGVDTTNPSAILNNARCFTTCIPQDAQLAVQNYLLALLVG